MKMVYSAFVFSLVWVLMTGCIPETSRNLAGNTDLPLEEGENDDTNTNPSTTPSPNPSPTPSPSPTPTPTPTPTPVTNLLESPNEFDTVNTAWATGLSFPITVDLNVSSEPNPLDANVFDVDRLCNAGNNEFINQTLAASNLLADAIYEFSVYIKRDGADETKVALAQGFSLGELKTSMVVKWSNDPATLPNIGADAFGNSIHEFGFLDKGNDWYQLLVTLKNDPASPVDLRAEIAPDATNQNGCVFVSNAQVIERE